jgi:hypothetical protein
LPPRRWVVILLGALSSRMHGKFLQISAERFSRKFGKSWNTLGETPPDNDACRSKPGAVPGRQGNEAVSVGTALEQGCVRPTPRAEGLGAIIPKNADIWNLLDNGAPTPFVHQRALPSSPRHSHWPLPFPPCHSHAPQTFLHCHSHYNAITIGPPISPRHSHWQLPFP